MCTALKITFIFFPNAQKLIAVSYAAATLDNGILDCKMLLKENLVRLALVKLELFFFWNSLKNKGKKKQL